MPLEMANELDIQVLPLRMLLDGKPYVNYLDQREITAKQVYDELRAGKTIKTSAINIDEYMQAFRPYLEEGKDVLYLCFSSALSGTYQYSANAMEMLREEFPERKMYSVDTLCASMGMALLAYYSAIRRNEGQTIEEVRDFILENRKRVCHWFTVDDLHYLKKSGRISAGTEMIGTMLNIKPILHMDEEGHLVKVGIAKGRKASIRSIKEHMAELAVNPEEQAVFICHGDCIEDAQLLADIVQKQVGAKTITINYLSAEIAGHSGPGTLAVFFLGTHR